MRFYIITCLILLTSFSHVQAGKKLRVLFIGNSYTYVNNMPQIIADMATAMGDTLVWSMEALGGAALGDHYLSNPSTRSKIAAGNWDYVVLQEQSLIPAMPDDLADNLFIYAKKLDSMINLYNPCGETIFYMTWGRKNGEASFCNIYSPPPYNWPHFCTYRSMGSLLRLRYRMTADSNHAIVSPVGAVWHYLRDYYPSIGLYDADESHPSLSGSYAAACTFYTTLFKKNPALITYNSSISSTDAANIRTAVKKVAYDSLRYWHINQYRTEARFTHTLNAATATFISNAANASSHTWYFGDGQTSTSLNPVHTYNTAGSYPVKLVVNNNTSGCVDTAYALLKINASSINTTNAEEPAFTLSPNPAGDIIHLNSTAFLSGNYRITLSNALGQPIHEQQSLSVREQSINLSAYSSGLYFLSITKAGNTVYHEKIVKK